MIVGMSTVALQGCVIATDDVDLWVEALWDDQFQDCVRTVGGIYIPPLDQRPPTISGPGLGCLDLVENMSGLGTFEEEYRHARWLEVDDLKLPVLTLHRSIVSKRAANRAKDKAVLPLLEDLASAMDSAEDS